MALLIKLVEVFFILLSLAVFLGVWVLIRFGLRQYAKDELLKARKTEEEAEEIMRKGEIEAFTDAERGFF